MINSAGCYVVTNKSNDVEKYIVLISGHSPFLKIEYIWHVNKKYKVSDDVFRGKDFSWEFKQI